jgi:3-oxoacyl-[acyl-carrier-protein] synthase II
MYSRETGVNNHRVVITGLAALTPLGLTIEEFWRGLSQGKSGCGPITLFDASSYPVKVAAEVKNFHPEDYMTSKRVDRSSRCTHFAIAASKEAVQSANLDMSRENPERIGVVIATSGSPDLLIDEGEVLRKRGPKRIDPLIISKISANMIPAQVGLELGVKGPNTSINSACASGSDAIGHAFNFIRLGHAEVMICGGAEAQVTHLSIAATGLVGALTKNPDPQKASRPFDKNRDGFVFGEGTGILILESYEHARKRNAPILAEIAGAGWSFDAYSETAPDADQQAVAMKMALRDAGIAPDDIDYINAHGTSTQLNDAAETKAIKMVFGENAYKIPVSSNKSMIGHLACAAGAAEAVATVMTINNSILPPTINYETPDPNCDLDYIPNKAREKAVNMCLSNSFGMGGQNCSLVIKHFS